MGYEDAGCKVQGAGCRVKGSGLRIGRVCTAPLTCSCIIGLVFDHFPTGCCPSEYHLRLKMRLKRPACGCGFEGGVP